MRSKKAMFNFISTIILELATIMSSFVLPPLFIKNYGTDAYGLTTSITQFMSYLTLLQSGVGGVVKAALYKPLAQKDVPQLNRTIAATESFFRKLSGISVAYIIILVFVFSFFKSDFGFAYTTSLVLIISIGSVLQYYFGITYQMLLEADQKLYIYSILQLGCTVMNIVITYLAIYSGATIQVAKLVSVTIFALRPLIINVFVRKKYSISKAYGKDDSAIAQRWNGLGQTIAYFVHTKSGIFLTTTILDFSKVTIYSIYSLVTTALSTFISAISKAVQAAFGNMLAKNEADNVQRNFNAFLTLIHIITTVAFATAIVMILPFIKIYTGEFSNREAYIQPMFAILLVMAECMYCYRMPYHTIVISAGHYKQTRTGAYLEAIISIVISLLCISFWGISGVATGTLVAMIYRTVDYVIYLRKNIIYTSVVTFFKHICVNAVTFIVSIPLFRFFQAATLNGYLNWMVAAMGVFVLLLTLTILLHLVFFTRDVQYIFSLLKGLLKTKKRK